MKRLKPNKLNFIARLADERDAAAKKAQRFKMLLPLLIALAVVVGLSGYFLVRIYLDLGPKLAKLQEYTMDEQVLTDYYSTVALQNQLDTLTYAISRQEGAFANIASHPELDGPIWQSLIAASWGKVQLLSMTYDRESGALVLDCQADNALQASTYAQALEAKAILNQVSYFGYDSDDEQDATGMGKYLDYKFTVVCSLPGGSTVQDGAAQDGAAQDGAAQDGAAQDGAAQDGAAQDGAAQDGAAQDGAAQDGAAQDNAAQDGAAQEEGVAQNE